MKNLIFIIGLSGLFGAFVLAGIGVLLLTNLLVDAINLILSLI